MKLSRNQKGFSPLEVILMIVIFAIVAGIALFVWSGQKSDNKTAEDTNTSTSSKTDQSTTSADKTNYLYINEWGVRIPVSEALNGITYTVHESSTPAENYIAFTYSSLKGGKECGSDMSVGILNRFTAEDVDMISGVKLTETYPDSPKIGDYYYYAGLPQAACTEDATIQTKISNARKPFTDAVAGVKAIEE